MPDDEKLEGSPEEEMPPSDQPSEETKAPDSASRNQIAYWRRKFEEAKRERDALAEEKKKRELAELSELEALKLQLDEAKAREEMAMRRAARLEAIAEADLPPEVAAIVPDLPPDEVRAWIEERAKPLADRLREQTAKVGQITNPAPGGGGLPDEGIFAKYMRMPPGPEKDRFYLENREEILREYGNYGRRKEGGRM